MEYKSHVTAETKTKFWITPERIKHNAAERQRRMVIRKHVKKLKECLPNIKQENDKRLSRNSIVKKAISYIQETKETNNILRDKNTSLENENIELAKEKIDLTEQSPREESQTETKGAGDCILENSSSDEPFSLFNKAVNFDENIAKLMVKDILNSSPEFWSFRDGKEL